MQTYFQEVGLLFILDLQKCRILLGTSIQSSLPGLLKLELLLLVVSLLSMGSTCNSDHESSRMASHPNHQQFWDMESLQ